MKELIKLQKNKEGLLMEGDNMYWPIIIYSDFNQTRVARDDKAAQFDIVEESGKDYPLWMNEKDIIANMKSFPHAESELKLGYIAYKKSVGK